jgi:hypothetical protein
MKKKSTLEEQGPLQWFLAQTFDANESRLAFLAQEAATKAFDLVSFKTELVKKLKTLRYPQPDSEQGISKKTFHEILEQAGVIELLLQEDVLRGLWQRRLLKDLLNLDDEMRAKGLSMEGVLLREHKEKVKKIQKDIGTLERIAKEYDIEAAMAECYEKMARECVKAWRPIMTARYPGSKGEIILSRPSNELPHNLRSEHTAIQAIIYLWLKGKLQTKNTKEHGIFDIFLCQLSELIWNGPDAQGLSDGKTIRKMAARINE